MRTSRRDVLGQIALGTGGLALGCGAGSATSGEATAARRSGGTAATRVASVHEPRPLPFDPATLNGLSERLIRSHHEHNYAGAVRKLNACRRELAAAPDDMPGFAWGGLAKSELVFANSVALHELYFENLGGDGRETSAVVDGELAGAFGGRPGWEADFRRCAMSLAGGSGWVILSYDRHRGELAHRVCSDHGHAGAHDAPLLVLDMYEHSYHLDYGASAGEYVDAFLANVRWDVVEARHTRAAR